MTTTPTRPRPGLGTDQRAPVARVCAVTAAGILAALVAFQVALAAGARLGQAAWGGQHTTLPPGLRIATIVPIAIYLLGAPSSCAVRVIARSDCQTRPRVERHGPSE